MSEPFLGTAETEVFIPSLGKSVKVTPRQKDEGVPTLDRASFAKASALQKAKDAQFEADRANPSKGSQRSGPASDRPAPNPKPSKVGKPSSRRTIKGPTVTPVETLGSRAEDLRISALDSRIGVIEKGMSMILAAIQGANQQSAAPLSPGTLRYVPPTDGCDEEPEAVNGFVSDFDDEEADVTCYTTPDVEPEDEEDGAEEIPQQPETPAHLAGVVELIQRKNSFKVFRTMWVRLLGNLCSIQGWSSEKQSEVEKSFNMYLYDLGFLEGVYGQVRQFSNGAVIGPQILFNCAVLLAGCSAVLVQASNARKAVSQ